MSSYDYDHNIQIFNSNKGRCAYLLDQILDRVDGPEKDVYSWLSLKQRLEQIVIGRGRGISRYTAILIRRFLKSGEYCEFGKLFEIILCLNLIDGFHIDQGQVPFMLNYLDIHGHPKSEFYRQIHQMYREEKYLRLDAKAALQADATAEQADCCVE